MEDNSLKTTSSSPISGFGGDLRQMLVISKNEIKKFFRGNRILIFTVLVVAILALMTAIPYIWGDGYDSPNVLAQLFTTFVPLIVEIAVVLFTATSIVSEFEERTALILFTKPVKKSTIFLGKLIASLVVVYGFTLIYYAYIVILSLITQSFTIPSGLGTSLGLSLLGGFGCAGLAMLMSSFFKKGSTASIMTLVVVLLLLNTVSSMLYMFAQIDQIWAISSAFDYCCQIFDNSRVLTFETASIVMVAYGVLCNIAAYILFSRRDF